MTTISDVGLAPWLFGMVEDNTEPGTGIPVRV
jgi:hypothetical protein